LTLLQELEFKGIFMKNLLKTAKYFKELVKVAQSVGVFDEFANTLLADPGVNTVPGLKEKAEKIKDPSFKGNKVALMNNIINKKMESKSPNIPIAQRISEQTWNALDKIVSKIDISPKSNFNEIPPPPSDTVQATPVSPAAAAPKASPKGKVYGKVRPDTQTYLNELLKGIVSLDVDGMLGDETITAMKLFKQKYHVDPFDPVHGEDFIKEIYLREKNLPF
jgi:hypothetical protein